MADCRVLQLSLQIKHSGSLVSGELHARDPRSETPLGQAGVRELLNRTAVAWLQQLVQA